MSRVVSAPNGLSPNFLPILAVFLVTGFALFTGWLYAPIAVFAFVVAGWIITLCLHESAHALVAYWGGDRGVVQRGYLTLDPLAYAHPLMTFGLPILFLLLGGIGLPGGAVYINTGALRSKHWDAFCSAAGPLANLVVLVVLSIPFMLGMHEQVGTAPFWGGLAFLAALQGSAVVLNLLPIPGFDGFGIIRPYLPYDMQAQAIRAAPIVSMLALLLLWNTQFGGMVWGAVFRLTDLFGLDPQYIFYGLSLFRFWN
ncbi:site-2 protease family protein [Labrys miyagiensis]|uniref:Site-2 protease family protein n=1 Tax=Labrys miyagiensis TaxID=346912 RepID=A0ABQ6CKN4_9HYPH|nr:site-2 protease family protein [Labrys miyagiensis]GLS19435.1 site-2 protease family protein [Labrys miyagiensis]